MIDLEGLDGIERDIAKLKNLSGPYKYKMRPHWARAKKEPTPHNITNLCTESSRADAYVNGHIMAVSYGILATVILVQAAVIIWLIV